jgi:hypothetical protein
MQAWKLPLAAALDELLPPAAAAEDELDDAPPPADELLPPLDGLLPQAASARASPATPTAVADVRTRGPSCGTVDILPPWLALGLARALLRDPYVIDPR